VPKSAVEPMNSIKNKLNSKIVLIFNPNPNTHSMKSQDETAIHNFKLMTSSNIAKLWCLLEFSPPTWVIVHSGPVCYYFLHNNF